MKVFMVAALGSRIIALESRRKEGRKAPSNVKKFPAPLASLAARFIYLKRGTVLQC